MQLELSDNEKILLRHKILYNKRDEGTLCITDRQIAILEAGVRIPWASVQKDQYSPANVPEVMLRLTISSAPKPLIIQLIGDEVSRLRATLETMKAIFRDNKQPAATVKVDESNETVRT